MDAPPYDQESELIPHAKWHKKLDSSGETLKNYISFEK